MLEVSGLTQIFGGVTALDDVSFRINQGDITGVIGPNGAGKTTTLRMLTGFLQPTAGRIKVKDLAYPENSLEKRLYLCLWRTYLQSHTMS